MTLVPVLSESKPNAAVDTTLFAVNIGTAVQGTIFCINQGQSHDQISIGLVSNGAIIDSNCYICYDTTAYYGQSIYLQQIYLNSEDSIVVNSKNGTSSFTFTGYQL